MFICQNFVFISAPLQCATDNKPTNSSSRNKWFWTARKVYEEADQGGFIVLSVLQRAVWPSQWTGRSLLWLPFLGDVPSCVEKSIVVRSGTANSSFRASGSSGQETSGSHSIITPTPSPKSLWTQVSDHPAFSPNDKDNKEGILCKLRYLSTRNCCSQKNLLIEQLYICNRMSLFDWNIYEHLCNSTLCTVPVTCVPDRQYTVYSPCKICPWQTVHYVQSQ